MRLKQSPPRWMASRPVRTLTISSRCISTGHLKYCYFPSKPNQSNNVHRFLNSADFGIANDRKHHWCCQDLESKFHPDHIPETLFFFSATKPMKPKTYQSTKCAKDRSARVHVVFFSDVCWAKRCMAPTVVSSTEQLRTRCMVLSKNGSHPQNGRT